MSSPKPIQIPPPDHVKFTESGRAYTEMERLIESELERITGQKQPTSPASPPPTAPAQPAPASSDKNGGSAT